MRPIDADALLKLIKDTNDGYRYGYLDATDIHNAPTLTLDDLRPTAINLKAEWPSLFQCSACGWDDGDTYTGDTDTYNYCPNCGAKMGGGE